MGSTIDVTASPRKAGGPHRDQHPAQPRPHTWSPRRPEKARHSTSGASPVACGHASRAQPRLLELGPRRHDRDRAARRVARVPFRLDGRGLRLRRGRAAHVGGLAHDHDPTRYGHPADAGAHARQHGDDGRDARPPVGWTVPARPRSERAPGRRGLARPAVRQAARQDARVRRDRARDPAPRTSARAPRAALRHPLLGAGRHRPGQAAQADRPSPPRRHPRLPGRDRAEERGPGGRDRRRLAADLLLGDALRRGLRRRRR